MTICRIDQFSLRGDRNLKFVRAPRRIRERFADVVLFKIGIELQDFFPTMSGSNQSDDGTDSNTDATDARPSAHDLRVCGDAGQRRHTPSIRRSIVASNRRISPAGYETA